MSTPRNQRSRNIGKCIKKPIWIVEQWVNDSNYKHIIYQARTWSANSRLSSEHLFVCPGVVVSWRGGRVDISWWWSVLLRPVGGGEDDIDKDCVDKNINIIDDKLEIRLGRRELHLHSCWWSILPTSLCVQENCLVVDSMFIEILHWLIVDIVIFLRK